MKSNQAKLALHIKVELAKLGHQSKVPTSWFKSPFGGIWYFFIFAA